MTGFVLKMTGFVLNMIGLVLNVTEFVVNMTGFVLNKTGFRAYFSRQFFGKIFTRVVGTKIHCFESKIQLYRPIFRPQVE